MVNPPHAELQKQTLWLFGVLVGLAIKEALTDVYDHAVAGEHILGGWVESIRLFVFLLIAVRFYLGAVTYYYNVYGADNADTEYPQKSFRLDFLFNFGHFVFVCLLGLSAIAHESNWWMFIVLVVVVLGYDLPWYIASRKLSTKLAIRLWMTVNVVTIFIGGVFWAIPAGIFLFLNRGDDALRGTLTYGQLACCEATALIPVVVFSVIDLASILGKESAIEKWLAEALPHLRRGS
jgi:hypothetical protein